MKNKSVDVKLTEKDIRVIRAMAMYLLTEDNTKLVDYDFQDKLFDLDEKFERFEKSLV